MRFLTLCKSFVTTSFLESQKIGGPILRGIHQRATQAICASWNGSVGRRRAESQKEQKLAVRLNVGAQIFTNTILGSLFYL